MVAALLFMLVVGSLGGVYYIALRMRWIRQPAAETRRAHRANGQYRARPLLSQGETAFAVPLLSQLPSTQGLSCKVRLADIIEGERGDRASFMRVSQKHVDFVIYDKATFAVVMCIELDDVTHKGGRRAERDSFVDGALAAAGIRIAHVKAQQAYALSDIRSLLLPQNT